MKRFIYLSIVCLFIWLLPVSVRAVAYSDLIVDYPESPEEIFDFYDVPDGWRWLNNDHAQFDVTSPFSYTYTFDIDSITASNYNTILLSTQRHIGYCVLSDAPFSVTCSTDSYYQSYRTESYESVKLDNSDFYGVLCEFGGSITAPNVFEGTSSFPRANAYFRSVEEFQQNFYSSNVRFPELQPDEFLYDPELGVVQGFSGRSALIRLPAVVYHLGFDTLTSNNVVLYNDSRFADLRLEYFYRGTVSFLDSSGVVQDSTFVDSAHDFISNIYVQDFYMSDLVTSLGLDHVNPLHSSRVYNFGFFYRILATKNGQPVRSDWVMVIPNRSNNTITVTPGSFSGSSFVPGSSGSVSNLPVSDGDDINQAVNNIPQQTIIPGLESASQVVPTLQSLFAGIVGIPAVIGQIFSFLPGWCLSLFALSIGLSCVGIILKLLS